MKNGKEKYFSVCTGVGGFEIGIRDKAECIGFSEVERSCNQLLKNKFPYVNNYGDITKIIPKELPEFDGLCGGFPCQPFSLAGKRGGYSDTRGTIFFYIAGILKIKRPSIVILENVKGILNHKKGETFRVILQTLEELGYNIQWMVLNSKFFGVPQNRERVFIIGNLRGTSRSEILPFRENAGEIQRLSEEEVSHPITAKYSGHCTLSDIKKSRATIVYDRKGFDSRTKGFRESTISPTLSTKMGTRGNNVPMVVAVRQRDRHGKNEEKIQQFEPRTDVTNTLTSVDKDNYLFDGKLRKFTPEECERLQGFPEGWTKEFPDTTRYKMMGNAVTVNVIKELANKIWKQKK
jgi:DNA (cytosine-5)-methyltransferase 1